MDMNYILGREQLSLHNASIAKDSSVRAAHEGLAAAYGKLLAKSTFPHRAPLALVKLPAGDRIDDWENEGGLVAAV